MYTSVLAPQLPLVCMGASAVVEASVGKAVTDLWIQFELIVAGHVCVSLCLSVCACVCVSPLHPCMSACNRQGKWAGMLSHATLARCLNSITVQMQLQA